MSKKVLITGGAGFIGSNLVRFIMSERPTWTVLNVDSLTYSGNLENVAGLPEDRHRFVKADICDRSAIDALMGDVDCVLHLAAESHVDRSIMDSGPFINTNVLGTQVMLDAARAAGIERFVHVSTDEVYGSLPLDRPELLFTEDTPIQPNSPYAASKAASDLLVRAACETHGFNASITRCSNNFGPYQFPEKVIPLFVTNLMEDQQVPLYGDGLNVRDWLHVEDHCEAIVRVLEDGKPGDVYNIGGNNEQSNLDLTLAILDALGKDRSMIRPVEDRLGHDRRYAIDATKIKRELGWEPTRSAWPNALEDTVKWYVDNEDWWRRVKDGTYRDYYERQYNAR